MQVKIAKTFPIDAGPEQAWRLLSDVKSVAECMPGAEITEQIDDTHYHGQVRVKIGPATMQFKGEIEVKSLDAGARVLRLVGTGADVKGTSSAVMDLTATVGEAGGKAEVVGDAEISVTGKLVSLGGRMMNQVSEQLIKQFAHNFTARVMAMGDSGEPAAAPAPEAPQALNGLAFLWAVMVGFLKGLFSRQPKRADR